MNHNQERQKREREREILGQIQDAAERAVTLRRRLWHEFGPDRDRLLDQLHALEVRGKALYAELRAVRVGLPMR